MAEEEKTTQDSTNNSTTIASSDEMVSNLSKKRDALISASFENPEKSVGNGQDNNSIIDIISNYTWNNETASSSGKLSYSTNINIPCCFAIEREQTVASSIMNIVRDANIVKSGFNKVIEGLKSIAGADSGLTEAIEAAQDSKIANFMNKLVSGRTYRF